MGHAGSLAPKKTCQTKQTGDMRDLKWREMKPMIIKIATANWKLENNDKVAYTICQLKII